MMHSIDIIVQTYLSNIHTPILTKFMLIATNLFEEIFLISLVFLIAVLIYYRKGLRNSLLLVVTFVVGETLVLIFKIIFDVSRPLNGLVVETSKSFPSSHATGATILFVMLIYLFSKDINKIWRWMFNIFCVLVCLYFI